MRALSKRQISVVIDQLEQSSQAVLAVISIEQDTYNELEDDTTVAAENLAASIEMLEASLEVFQELKEILAGAVE